MYSNKIMYSKQLIVSNSFEYVFLIETKIIQRMNFRRTYPSRCFCFRFIRFRTNAVLLQQLSSQRRHKVPWAYGGERFVYYAVCTNETIK